MKRTLVSALATAALALTAVATTTATAAPTGAPFATQAAAAGLTEAQAQNLQKNVERVLAEEGGVQIAANEINAADGTNVLLPLPGEKFARDLDTSGETVNVAAAAAPSSCGSYTFCAYKGTNFSGTVKRQRLCSETMSISWVGAGSWSNNQSSGTKARMYGSAGQLIFTTPGAYSEDRSGNWTPVYKVDAC